MSNETQSRDGGPAFPVVASNGLGHVADGMTLRGWFAGQALMGMAGALFNESFTKSVCADRAYALADAMLRARATGGGQ